VPGAKRKQKMFSTEQELKDVLEGLYAKYNRRELISPDPLQWVYKFSRKSDMEIAGFVAAALAYGRVEQINRDLGRVFDITGKRPAEFAGNFSGADRKKFADFKHRFTTGEDMADLFEVFKVMLARWGSIEKCFTSGGADGKNILPSLEAFCEQIHRELGREFHKGLRYLVTSPVDGSVCKRMNLFLRWMVRKDDVDAGLWKSIDKSQLIVPVDVHIARLTKILGFHGRKTTSIKTAIEITEEFAKIEPTDPVKYDFALSRIGIVEGCTGKRGGYCDNCELLSWCGKNLKIKNKR
jgi:uncharacterized protein (TIGR02757 family)